MSRLFLAKPSTSIDRHDVGSVETAPFDVRVPDQQGPKAMK